MEAVARLKAFKRKKEIKIYLFILKVKRVVMKAEGI